MVRPDRLDKRLYGLTWALANRPDIFFAALPDRNVGLFKGAEDLPYRVWYTFDDDTVTLMAIGRWMP